MGSHSLTNYLYSRMQNDIRFLFLHRVSHEHSLALFVSVKILHDMVAVCVGKNHYIANNEYSCSVFWLFLRFPLVVLLFGFVLHSFLWSLLTVSHSISKALMLASSRGGPIVSMPS